MRKLLAALALGAAGAAFAQAPVDETRDFGVPPQAALKLGDFSSPTPREIPGAKTIDTAGLRALIDAPPAEQPLLFDVLGFDPMHTTIPGSIWLPDAGRGHSYDDALQERLGKALEQATQGNRAKPMVFFCAGLRCWLSYNAALRAARLGYTEVYWYRGGVAAWRGAGGRVAPPRVIWQQPAERGR